MSDLPGDRDEVVAAALRDLPVPDHRPGFWDELEASLAEDGPATQPAPAAGPSTGELPAVTALTDRSPHRRRAPLVAGAAAAAVLLVAVGLVLLGGDGGGDDPAQVADAPEATDETSDDTTTTNDTATTDGSGDATEPSTTTTSIVTQAPDSPEQVAATWLDALGSGDVATAAALTGPRTATYIQSMDPAATVEGFLTESEAAYRGWVGSNDRQIHQTDIGGVEFDGGTLSVVVVSGTYAGAEGPETTRVDVFPLMDDGEGFKVEHLAFSPAHENDPVFTVPAETDTGLGGVGPDAEINVFVPSPGEVWFSVDGAPAESDTTSIVADAPFAVYDPGDLAPGPHQLVVVALGEDGTIAHDGGTFVVEG